MSEVLENYKQRAIRSLKALVRHIRRSSTTMATALHPYIFRLKQQLQEANARQPARVAILGTLAVAVLLITSFKLLSAVHLPKSSEMERSKTKTSILYSSPAVIEVGQRLDWEALELLFESLGLRNSSKIEAVATATQQTEATQSVAQQTTYAEATSNDHSSLAAKRTLRPGFFAKESNQGDDFSTELLTGPGERLEIVVENGTVSEVSLDGESAASLNLGPVELSVLLNDSRYDRRPTELATLPAHVYEAVLAAEDAGFFDHNGIATAGILRAAFENFKAGRIVQGASTITQQTARNLFLTLDRNWHRKFNEAVLALALEIRWSKEEILNAYIDTVYLGSRWNRQLIGIGAASQVYFGVDPQHLTVAESALLAGMIASPARFDPLRNPSSAKSRRDFILGRMLEEEFIGVSEYQTATAEPIVLRASYTPIWTEHFAQLAQEQVRETLNIASVADRGLQLHSTLDWFEQYAALETLERGLDEGKHQGALVSMNPGSGEVRAYVGGSPLTRSSFDRAGTSTRQIGSLAKPFVFAAAFEQGTALPSSKVLDLPVELRFEDVRWQPRNGKGEYRGMVTAAEALRLSLNSAAVRLALSSGLESVVHTLRLAGFEDSADGPSVVLGALESTLLDVVAAYGVFANDGEKVKPLILTRVDHDEEHRSSGGSSPDLSPNLPNSESNAELAASLDGEESSRQRLQSWHRDARKVGSTRVVSAEASYLVHTTLRGVVEGGTGWRIRRDLPKQPLAGKTGTTNDGRDAWFVGYSRERVIGVWLGADDYRNAHLAGGADAAPVWAKFASQIKPTQGFSEIERPQAVRWSNTICGDTEGWTTPSFENDSNSYAHCPSIRTDGGSPTGVALTMAALTSRSGDSGFGEGSWTNFGRFDSDRLESPRALITSRAAYPTQDSDLSLSARVASAIYLRDGWTHPSKNAGGNAGTPIREVYLLDGPLGEVRGKWWQLQPSAPDVATLATLIESDVTLSDLPSGSPAAMPGGSH